MMNNIQHKKRTRLKGFDYKGCYRYSLTFCTREKLPQFEDDIIVRNTADILRETAREHKFKIWSFCFMPDHLHVLVEGENQTSDLRKFASLFKQKSGYRFCHYNGKIIEQGFSPPDGDDQATGNTSLTGCPTEKDRSPCKDLWQINYYEHVLRSDEATEKTARYILENPVRRGLVEDFCDYHFSWCEVFGFMGQGFSPAKNDDSCRAGLKPCDSAPSQDCPTEETLCNPEGLPYNVNDRKSDFGFTLVEIVITIVIIGILSGIAALIILQGVSAYSSEQSRSDVHYQARLAVERIAREARMIRSCADIAGPANPSATLSFVDINGNAVSFSYAGGNLSRGANLLSSGITSAQPFTFLDVNGNQTTACPGIWFVAVDVIGQNGSESAEMRTRVHPRNF